MLLNPSPVTQSTWTERAGSRVVMNAQEVATLMETSTSELEWNANVDKVKDDCDGYPDFWYETVIASGLMSRVSSKWGGTDEIKISSC